MFSKHSFAKFGELIRLKFKFALTSLIATGIDYGLYLLLVYTLFEPVIANTIAYSIAVVFNFLLQKQFVFSTNRKPSTVFWMAMGVSVFGLGWSNLIIWGLTQKVPCAGPMANSHGVLHISRNRWHHAVNAR